MKNNPPSRFELLVDTYLKNAVKENRNRNYRVNEVSRSAEQVEREHGKIPRLGMLLRKLPENLIHAYDPKRNSFGYKETAERLESTINQVMGNSIFVVKKK